MSQHLGATYSLSLIIIIVSASVFYRADPPPKRAPETANPAARGELAPGGPTRSEPEQRGRIAVRSEARALRDAASITPPSPTGSKSINSAHVRPEPPKDAVGAPAKPAPTPRDPFVRVEAESSLAELARRAYGSDDMLAEFWKANRDQLSSPESPLHAGMLLRKP